MTLAPVAPITTGIDLVRLGNIVQTLDSIEKEVNNIIVERGPVVQLLKIAMVAREHMAIIGPPGAAKSDVVRKLVQRMAAGLKLFVAHCNKTTRPDDLFGPQDLRRYEETGDMVRKYKNYLPGSQIAIFEELFKLAVVMQNDLLLGLNERLYKDGDVEVEIPLMTAVGTSNEFPEEPEQAAVWDRFLVRYVIDGYLSTSGFSEFVDRFANNKFKGVKVTSLANEELFYIQECVDDVHIPTDVVEKIKKLRGIFSQDNILLSERRFVKIFKFLKAYALTQGRDYVMEDDMLILKHIIWQEPGQRGKVNTILHANVESPETKVIELADNAKAVMDTVRQFEANRSTNPSANSQNRTQVITEAKGKLSRTMDDMEGLINLAAGKGRDVTKIKTYLTDVDNMMKELGQIFLRRG